MENRIRSLLAQINALEEELRGALHERETSIFFQIKGKRIEFEGSVKKAHVRLKQGFFHWLLVDRPQNLLTGPFIYGLGIPLVILDLFVTVYQAICFPVYGIAQVKRVDYIAFDRKHLGYLNFIEKFHCQYCAYANGLLAYVSEISARTEQYFCPIKHARKLLGSSARSATFMEYGDAADYHARLEGYRVALKEDVSEQG
jgi:hypothetical protein